MQWEVLAGLHVCRARMFQCPTLNDGAVLDCAGFFMQVPVARAPFELHLSDGAFGSRGFAALIEAIV